MMKMNKILEFGKKILKNRKLTTAIGTTVVVLGIGATVIRAIKDTPEVNRIVDDATVEKGEDLSLKEKVVLYSKGYWKTIAIGTATILLVVGMSVLSEKSYAGLATAYALTNDKINSYKEAVDEIVDNKTKEKINSKVVEKEITKAKENKVDVIKTTYGDTLIFDSWSGRYFYGDIEKVRQVINDANDKLLNDGYVPVDDIYWELGLPSSDMGSRMGWDYNMNSYLIQVRFDTILTDDNKACITINFVNMPEYLR